MRTKSFILLGLLTFLIFGNGMAQTPNSKNYKITLNKIPGSGGGPDITKIISGKVEGKDVSSLLIVIYAKAGGKWWVQPTTDNPFTKINTSGLWQNETHLGIQYGVLLVYKSFKPQNTYTTLPQTDNSVVSVIVVDAAK